MVGEELLTAPSEADLLRQHIDDDGTLTFEWSNLFKRLPKTIIKKILEVPRGAS